MRGSTSFSASFPAFFIAGAIGVFVSQASVMKYLGPKANKALAYGVASVSGTILAVCSCTVLPLFAGIWRMGAGLGPATAFLYSGPAINVLAIVLTARVLGLEAGHRAGRRRDCVQRRHRAADALDLPQGGTWRRPRRQAQMPEPEVKRPLWQNIVLFRLPWSGILVFANWGKPMATAGFWHAVWTLKWPITAAFAARLASCS